MLQRIRNYPVWRRLWEPLYTALTPNAWPARFAWRLNPRADITVERHTIAVGTPIDGGKPLRIAFASDFHAGPATPWPVLEQGAAMLDELNPDLLLLGGDFVSIDPHAAARLAPLLGAIRAPLGRYAVLGNHDHWADGSIVADYLQQAGIEMLTNRCVALPPPFDLVSICGVDDHTAGDPNAAAAFAEAGSVRVLLMHAPSGLLDVGDRQFVVGFCGHTHGGQIALPNGYPLIIASGALSRAYNAGRYALPGERTLLVSRGLGYGTLPIRLNAPASVFLCTLASNGF